MHLAVRWRDAPLRLYRNARDGEGQYLSTAVVAGARSDFYVKQASGEGSVGAVLRPGAAQALFGCDADALASRHVALEDVWTPAEVDRLRDRLAHAATAAQRIALLHGALLARLRPVRAMHPPIAQALQSLRADARVGEVAAATACSHRHFIARFRAATGLSPKAFARVQRLRRALARMPSAASLADIALDAGYSDQAHFSREFRAMAGLTPQAYRRVAAHGGLHVPVNFLQDDGRAAP